MRWLQPRAASFADIPHAGMRMHGAVSKCGVPSPAGDDLRCSHNWGAVDGMNFTEGLVFIAILLAVMGFPALDSEEPKRGENKVEDIGLDDA